MHVPFQVYTIITRLIFTSILLISSLTAQTASPIWHTLEPGNYTVAFRSFTIVDSSRSMPPYAVRPLRIFLWYPSEGVAESAKNAAFGQYLKTPGDNRFPAYFDTLFVRDQSTASRQFRGDDADSLLQVLLEASVYVQESVKLHTEKFPLILHSLGRNNYQMESTVLWEYLASHGYIVATIPQMASTVQDHRLVFAMDDMKIQAEDLVFTSRHLQSKYEAKEIGLIGHSSGSVAGLLAAQLFDYDALVSLDGSISTSDGNELLDDHVFAAEKERLPILNLYVDGKRKLDLGLLDRMSNAERFHFAFDKALHFDFQNWPLYAILTGKSDPRIEGYRSSEQGAAVFLAAVRMTLQFLDAYLKEDKHTLEAFQQGRMSPATGKVVVKFDFKGIGE